MFPLLTPKTNIDFLRCKMMQNYQDIFYNLTPPELVLLAVFGVLFLIRLLYLFLFIGRVLFRKKRKNTTPEKNPLSLMMTVRNEEENLKNNLPKILSLPDDFELVVVDDFSQDNSYLIIGLLKDRYKRLTISALNQETKYSTKLAQNIALKAANYAWVIPIPVSILQYAQQWLETISGAIKNEKNVIISYSGVTAAKGFFNRLYRIENYYSYIRSTGFILNGIPFVYSDENVAFKKEKYFEIGGYGKKATEPYANLELIINSFIRKKTTTVFFNTDSSIKKSEQIKRSEYFELLKKSIRIEKHLSNYKRLALVFEEIVELLYIPTAIIVIVLFPELCIVFAGMLGFNFIAYLLIIKITQNRLNERKIFISSLVYGFIMPYFKLFYKLHFNRRSKKNRWRNKV